MIQDLSRYRESIKTVPLPTYHLGETSVQYIRIFPADLQDYGVCLALDR
jgi:hypothetical protein